MISKSNYNKDNESSPFKKGKIQDIVKPKRSRHTKVSYTSNKEVVDTLTIDLVQVLADNGICLKRVHTIARGLVKCGWIKIKKIEG